MAKSPKTPPSTIVQPAQLKKGVSPQIEADYLAALRDIKAKFQSKSRQAEAHFESLLGDKTFFRKSFLADRFDDENKATDLKDKLAIIAAHRLMPNNSLSNQVSSLISDSFERKQFSSKHDGYYRYWRYYPTEDVHDPVRWGVIKLETDPERGTAFSHWSHDRIVADEMHQDGIPKAWEEYSVPEDAGHAFFTHHRMFLLGFRTNNIRSCIGSLPGADNSRRNTVISGIVLTTRKTSGGVFAAGFVMVHQEHPRAHKHLTMDEFKSLNQLRVDKDKYMVCE